MLLEKVINQQVSIVVAVNLNPYTDTIILVSLLMILLYGSKIRDKWPTVCNLILNGFGVSVTAALTWQVIHGVPVLVRLGVTTGHTVAYLYYVGLFWFVSYYPNKDLIRGLRLTAYAVSLQQVYWSLMVIGFVPYAFLNSGLIQFMLVVGTLLFGLAASLWHDDKWTLKYVSLVGMLLLPNELLWGSIGIPVTITSLGVSIYYTNLQVNLLELMDMWLYIALFALAYYFTAKTWWQVQRLIDAIEADRKRIWMKT